VKTQFFCHMFNALNHTNWGTPFLDLQDPPAWGTTSGGYGSFGNYGRVVELGLRVQF